MRLPTDATLLLGDGAEPELIEAWREERLPVLAVDLLRLEAELEALDTATVVACGAGAANAAALAARLGFRTFLVGDAPASDEVCVVSLDQALAAARMARARERWKAGRAGGSD
jgi:hypothetical protein